MKKYAIIVAGGSGSRMGSPLPKQFLLIHDQPVLWYTLQAFLRSYEDMMVILVLPSDYLAMGKIIAGTTEAPHRIEIIAGGPTRFHSVQKGLSCVQEQSIIFVHDGVRCLITSTLIHRCFEDALQFGSAVPCVDCKDSVRILLETGHKAVKRTLVKLMQTPQTFQSELLKTAYATDYREEFTDETSVVEALHCPIHLVDGEQNNIKITTPLDLYLAEKLLTSP
jgi:2-C-methyl-D-erythritol 4-phosphate cytidylyltransferase